MSDEHASLQEAPFELQREVVGGGTPHTQTDQEVSRTDQSHHTMTCPITPTLDKHFQSDSENEGGNSGTVVGPWADRGVIWNRELGLVERETKTGSGVLNSLVNEKPESNPKFQCLKSYVDSGAARSVCPPEFGGHFGTSETAASKRGEHFRTATGKRVRSQGGEQSVASLKRVTTWP